MSGQGKLSISVSKVVDMHRPITALCGHVFIQRIPSHALHIVVMFSDLPQACSVFVEYSRNIVHTSCDEELAIRRPCQIVDLRVGDGAEGSLDPPRLFILAFVLVKVGMLFTFIRDPEQYGAVISRRG